MKTEFKVCVVGMSDEKVCPRSGVSRVSSRQPEQGRGFSVFIHSFFLFVKSTSRINGSK